MKSVSRFEFAANIAAQTRGTLNLTAVSCQTFGLGHMYTYLCLEFKEEFIFGFDSRQFWVLGTFDMWYILN